MVRFYLPAKYNLISGTASAIGVNQVPADSLVDKKRGGSSKPCDLKHVGYLKHNGLFRYI